MLSKYAPKGGKSIAQVKTGIHNMDFGVTVRKLQEKISEMVHEAVAEHTKWPDVKENQWKMEHTRAIEFAITNIVHGLEFKRTLNTLINHQSLPNQVHARVVNSNGRVETEIHDMSFAGSVEKLEDKVHTMKQETGSKFHTLGAWVNEAEKNSWNTEQVKDIGEAVTTEIDQFPFILQLKQQVVHEFLHDHFHEIIKRLKTNDQAKTEIPDMNFGETLTKLKEKVREMVRETTVKYHAHAAWTSTAEKESWETKQFKEIAEAMTTEIHQLPFIRTLRHVMMEKLLPNYAHL